MEFFTESGRKINIIVEYKNNYNFCSLYYRDIYLMTTVEYDDIGIDERILDLIDAVHDGKLLEFVLSSTFAFIEANISETLYYFEQINRVIGFREIVFNDIITYNIGSCGELIIVFYNPNVLFIMGDRSVTCRRDCMDNRIIGEQLIKNITKSARN